MFWGIYAIEPDMVWSKLFDEFVPNWHNQIMHTLPITSVFIECFIQKHEYNKSFVKGCFTPVLFGLSYITW